MNSHLPIVFAFVLGMAFLLLMLTFRSVVIPLQAIALNLLSVGAAYGLLVLVFQDGHLHQLLGFQGTSEITSWLPLFLFVVLFGLSMDYHVFILSRVREAIDRGLSAREAVRPAACTAPPGWSRARRWLWSACSRCSGRSADRVQADGSRLAAAILIDATVIRGVLLPATLALLGERAWREPRWLAWLPSRAAQHASRPHAAERAALLPEPIRG